MNSFNLMKRIKLINRLFKGSILICSLIIVCQCAGNERLISEDEDKIIIGNAYGIEFVVIKNGFRYGFRKTDGTLLVPAHPVSGLLAGDPENLSHAESTKYMGETGSVYSFEVTLENKTKVIVSLKPEKETALFELENPEDEAIDYLVPDTDWVMF